VRRKFNDTTPRLQGLSVAARNKTEVHYALIIGFDKT
jgi:hypothetical protein